MTDNQFKKLLNSGLLPVFIAGGLGVVSLACTAFVRQPEVNAIARILQQLAGYGTLGFSLCGLAGAFKSEKPFQIAIFCVMGLIFGIFMIGM